MATDNQIARIEQLVDTLLEEHPGFFKVLIKIKPINNVKVYIDGDEGIPIEKCVRLNKALYVMMEENALFPDGDYSLELSSPGVDEPLLLFRQYLKNINRSLEIVLLDGSQKEGKLITADESAITLEQVTGKGKKIQTEQLVIPFINIKTATVQVKF